YRQGRSTGGPLEGRIDRWARNEKGEPGFLAGLSLNVCYRWLADHAASLGDDRSGDTKQPHPRRCGQRNFFTVATAFMAVVMMLMLVLMLVLLLLLLLLLRL